MEIHILDESTIDKIAAGEVVDRPASVVKELVENAMDSGADAVTVEIKEGGISLIRVTDNGCGIEAAQIEKAFLRHATSKIRSAEDLLRLSSLGFRGEALSSICAVSQVEMITKTKEELTGVRYAIWGGVQKEKEEIGAPEGTTLLVRNLFYNVPARKKFLKSPMSEGGHISDLMEHLALSNPHISFKYVQNGQVKFHTSGNGDLREIIYRIYGREIAGELVPIKAEASEMKIWGFLGTPVVGRANRNFENYYINGRFIKSPLIAKAAEDAYKPFLMQHKYPFFVLHLSLSPDMLDVNVHPSKMEVRFHEQAEVADFLFQAISETLSNHEMLKKVVLTKEEEPQKDLSPVPEPFEEKARACYEEKETVSMPVFTEKEVLQTTQPAADNYEASDKPVVSAVFEENPYEAVKALDAGPASDMNTVRPVQMDLFEEKLLTKNLRSEYHVLGQVFDTYWIIVFRDKLFFMDQHAAHEKVKYERLLRQVQNSAVMIQQLNPPTILTLSGREEETYLQYQDYFARLGFEIEPFGGNEYAVRGIPMDLFGRSAKELLLEILDELSQGALRGEAQAITGKIASMSCKAAVKGSHFLSMAEAQALLDELMTLENPYHCPHGRPTVITMSKYELEKKFNRIV